MIVHKSLPPRRLSNAGYGLRSTLSQPAILAWRNTYFSAGWTFPENADRSVSVRCVFFGSASGGRVILGRTPSICECRTHGKPTLSVCSTSMKQNETSPPVNRPAAMVDRSPHPPAQEFRRYSPPSRSSISAMVGSAPVWETCSRPIPIPSTEQPSQMVGSSRRFFPATPRGSGPDRRPPNAERRTLNGERRTPHQDGSSKLTRFPSHLEQARTSHGPMMSTQRSRTRWTVRMTAVSPCNSAATAATESSPPGVAAK
jgi:hypothetical protein